MLLQQFARTQLTVVASLVVTLVLSTTASGAGPQPKQVAGIHAVGVAPGAGHGASAPRAAQLGPQGILPKLALKAHSLPARPLGPPHAQQRAQMPQPALARPPHLKIPAYRVDRARIPTPRPHPIPRISAGPRPMPVRRDLPKIPAMKLPASGPALGLLKLPQSLSRPPVPTFGPDRPNAPKQAIFQGGKIVAPMIPVLPPRFDAAVSVTGSKPTKVLSAIRVNLPFPQPDKGAPAKIGDRIKLLPSQVDKPDTNQWMKPDRPKPNAPEGSELGAILGLPADGNGLGNWQDWGDVPDVENGNPFGNPADPLGPSSGWNFGTQGPGAPDGSADPDDGGPILGILTDPSGLGIVWNEPEEPRGGSKGPGGGPGAINGNKGPAGADQIGKGTWPGGRGGSGGGTRWTRITEYHKHVAEMEYFKNIKTIEDGGVPVYEGPDNHYEDPKEYDDREDEEARFRQAQEEWKKEREKMERLKKRLNSGSGGCEGALDTGGGFEPPSSVGDIDKSKAGGSLVIDPAASQWMSGLSGVDPSNHADHVSNPGYEGGGGHIDGGVKHDPSQITNPARRSGH